MSIPIACTLNTAFKENELSKCISRDTDYIPFFFYAKIK